MAKGTCSIEGCGRGVVSGGVCGMHYMRWKRHRSYDRPLRTPLNRPCSIDGCERPHEAHGWCQMHLRRWRLYGDPLLVFGIALRVNTPEKFWARVQMDDGCWPWTGRTNSDGYGQYDWHGRTVHAHRLAYELTNGKVPEGLELDHLCRSRICCRPSHMEAVPHIENVRRGRAGRYPRSADLRAKMSAATKGRPHSAEHIRKAAEARWGRRQTEPSRRYT